MQPAPLRQSEQDAHKLQDVPKDCAEVLGAYLEQELFSTLIILRVNKLTASDHIYILLVLSVFEVEIRQTFIWK